MNHQLKQKLIALKKSDEQKRAELIQRGELFIGYHPEMEQIHNSNADDLSEILKQFGWPSEALVGEEASEAAWLIVQHAISKPDFQRECLMLLKEELKNGRIKPNLVAYLEDRILFFEGRLQIYGTQFDWDDSGNLSPAPIFKLEQVDHRRQAMGLGPLQMAIEQLRSQAKAESNTGPKDLQKHRTDFLQWTQRVGWRKV